MDYKEKSFNLIEYLKSIKFSASLTDAHKEFLTFRMELTSIKPEVPYAEIEDESEYNLIKFYIRQEIKNGKFLFEYDAYCTTKKYLIISWYIHR